MQVSMDKFHSYFNVILNQSQMTRSETLLCDKYALHHLTPKTILPTQIAKSCYLILDVFYEMGYIHSKIFCTEILHVVSL